MVLAVNVCDLRDFDDFAQLLLHVVRAAQSVCTVILMLETRQAKDSEKRTALQHRATGLQATTHVPSGYRLQATGLQATTPSSCSESSAERAHSHSHA